MDHTKNRIHLFYWRPRRNGASLGFKKCCFRMLRPHLFPGRPSSLSRLLAPDSTVPVVEAAGAGAPSFIVWELHTHIFECFVWWNNNWNCVVDVGPSPCRKPSCDFVNFRDWPSWQKVTMTSPTTWPFGRLIPWRHARIVAERGAAVVFSMFHITNCILFLTNKRNVWVRIPFSPTTIRSGMPVGMFQSAPSPGSPVKASSSTQTWGGVKFGSSQSATQADFCYRPYSWCFSRITRNTM